MVHVKNAEISADGDRTIVTYDSGNGIFQGSVSYDPECNVFYGKLLNTDALVTYEGSSMADLRKSFIDAVEDFMDF